MIPALLPNYARIDLAFERGEGAYLFGTDGRRYLDFAAGIAVNALGHCHPHLVAELKAQIDKVWHVSNLYRNPLQEKLAARLVEATFADSVFFCNSGAEANEAGIKMVRRYQYDQGHPERYRMITVQGAFHGRTLATIAAGGQPKYLEGFGPATQGFDQVAWGNLNELRAAITPETAGIIVEPVQGEGGIRPAALQYLRDLRKIADEFGLLLMLDEIQSGVGRTGKLFAYQWAGIEPDVMAVAKGIGGGFPVGCTLANEKAAKGMVPGTHGTTFGGNPLAMAAANAVMDVLLQPGFLDGVDTVARDLWHKLLALQTRHPRVIAEVRGAGLMLGLKCIGTNTDLQTAARDQDLITVTAGDNVLRLLPPLIITTEHVDEAVAALDRACVAVTPATQ